MIAGSPHKRAFERLAPITAVSNQSRRRVRPILIASVHIHAAIRKFDRHAFIRMNRILLRTCVLRAKVPSRTMVIAVNKMYAPAIMLFVTMIARNDKPPRVRPRVS